MSIIRKLFQTINSAENVSEADKQLTILTPDSETSTITSVPNQSLKTINNEEETWISNNDEETVTFIKNDPESEKISSQDFQTIINSEFKKGFQFAPKEQFKKGDVIGGEFTVEEVFGGEGKSGMGVVYLVRNRKVPLPFVLKTIQPTQTDPDSLSRFYKEVQAWVSIGWHPNIVKANWAELIDDTLYIAADYIPPDDTGKNTLTDYINDSRIVSNQQIISWSVQFVYAMQFAQQKGVRAHRDIKPDNIMIDMDGNLLVTDFGLASVSKDIHNYSVAKENNSLIPNIDQTQTGVGMGTLTYMAPEQFEDARSVDHRADIYAFGIMLYMLITGGRYPYNRPFIGFDAFLSYEEMHRTQNPIPIISPLSFIVDKCLMKQPEDRYQSYDELLADLLAVAKELNIVVPAKPNLEDDEKDELYMQAMSFRALREFDQALKLVSTFLSFRPDSYTGWNLKGRILLELGDLNEAIKATQKSIEIYPHNSTAWNNLALEFNKIGDYEKSVWAFHKALELDPENSGAWMNLAQSLEPLGQWEKIVTCYEIAFNLTPKKKTLHFNASNTVTFLLRAGEFEGALKIAKLVSLHNPEDQNNWHNLALIHQSNGDLREAIECFHKVEQLNPNDTFCLSSLALLYAQTRDIKNAIKYSEEAVFALREKRADWGSWHNIGKFYLQIGDPENAISFLEKTVQLNPEEISVLTDLGIAFETSNRNIEAIKTFVKIIEINMDAVSAYNSLAFTQIKIGQLEFALHNYEEGLKALIRGIVKNFANESSNPIMKTPNTSHYLWTETAMTGAFYLAAKSEEIENVVFPTSQMALEEESTNQHKGLYWIDELDESGKKRRMYLPNYFNTVFWLLKHNPYYYRLIASIGQVLKSQDKHEDARQYFEEAGYFRN